MWTVHFFPYIFDDSVPEVNKKKTFIFSTAGLSNEKKLGKDHSCFKEKLESRGYVIVDELQCKGFNTNSFIKYFDGINRGTPNAKDLKKAEEIVQNLKHNLQLSEG